MDSCRVTSLAKAAFAPFPSIHSRHSILPCRVLAVRFTLNPDFPIEVANQCRRWGQSKRGIPAAEIDKIGPELLVKQAAFRHSSSSLLRQLLLPVIRLADEIELGCEGGFPDSPELKFEPEEAYAGFRTLVQPVESGAICLKTLYTP